MRDRLGTPSNVAFLSEHLTEAPAKCPKILFSANSQAFCMHFYQKLSIFRRKMQIFVGGQKELTLVTLIQKSAKITEVGQSEHIFGISSLQASSCIHTYPKTVNFCRKMQVFVGGQNELTLVTLMQKSAKITKSGQSEHIFGNFSLQASSCIHS